MDLFEGLEPSIFPTNYKEIIQRVEKVNPVKYGKTRNFINGNITYLSPYISRGIISTKLVLKHVLNAGYTPKQIEKFIQELAWRDYWQNVWIAKGDAINTDLKHTQKNVTNNEIPKAIIEGKTGVKAIDDSIAYFYKTGYIHNHLRMYIAAITCNVAQSHWLAPAKWMYYNLLDADWASNALSWQWVAGANANKKYVANQNNINKYCFTDQKNTFLDIPYDAFSKLDIPVVLKNTIDLELKTPLPKQTTLKIDNKKPSYIYNFYNLDPIWDKSNDANRILLLEPSHFTKHPVCKNTIDFVIKFAKENIKDIQIFVGEFKSLVQTHNLTHIKYKEHPLNTHYQGTEIPRDWMFNVTGYYPSFFSFWKKCKKQLNY